MLFNSIEFALFLPIVFLLYWLIQPVRRKAQNLLIVLASYVFYGWWDWRFLTLLFCSTLIDYFIGISIHRAINPIRRKLILCLSIGFNLGFLFFFKYYQFFVENFVAAFTLFGRPIQAETLQIILPVGISFYTFQTLSYTIDIYRRKIEPTRDFISFAAFVSFFPQLVAGPIERASHLLPQFTRERFFDYSKAVDGLRQILWGLFKKMVIADSCAEYADILFGNSSAYSGSALLLGALFFTIQIYGDFSGYSDIAIGTARLFGFQLMRNFAYPYFSANMAEFWRRWHISLSSWFRDYVYIPLGGSRGSRWELIRNVFIVFILSGLWHGANWTFLVWGLIHALLVIPLILWNRNRQQIPKKEQASQNLVLEMASILLTFCITILTWVFFRAHNLEHAFQYLSGIFSASLFSPPVFPGYRESTSTLVLCFLFFLIEWHGRKQQYAIEQLGNTWHKAARWSMYLILAVFIILFYGNEQQFIYFQF